jgi:hypothetical protein
LNAKIGEIFESCVRSSGDMAGVFEFDGETSYFYLYCVDTDGGNKVLNAIRISVGEPNYKPSDVVIGWSSDERWVFLQLAGQICAVFDCVSKQSYGGDYILGVKQNLPPEIFKAVQTVGWVSRRRNPTLGGSAHTSAVDKSRLFQLAGQIHLQDKR